jgi:hypothetical protein
VAVCAQAGKRRLIGHNGEHKALGKFDTRSILSWLLAAPAVIRSAAWQSVTGKPSTVRMDITVLESIDRWGDPAPQRDDIGVMVHDL